MLKSLRVSLSADAEQFLFQVKPSEAGLVFNAVLKAGGESNQEVGGITDQDVGALLAGMQATEADDGGRLCNIALQMEDEGEYKAFDFPVKRLLETTIIGRVYQRLKQGGGDHKPH